MDIDNEKLTEQLREEMRNLLGQRRMIDMRLGQINLALRSMAIWLPEKSEEILAELKDSRRKPAGLTEAISGVLYHWSGALSATQIKEELEREGFDLSEYTQPLAVIFTTLRRLKKSGRVKTKKKGQRVYYEWAGK
jgi:hypothetical protein